MHMLSVKAVLMFMHSYMLGYNNAVSVVWKPSSSMVGGLA